jgi:hypothetical protein
METVRNYEAVERSKIVFYVEERETKSGEVIYNYTHETTTTSYIETCLHILYKQRNKETRFE